MPFAPSVANMNALISSYNEAASSSVYNFYKMTLLPIGLSWTPTANRG